MRGAESVELAIIGIIISLYQAGCYGFTRAVSYARARVIRVGVDPRDLEAARCLVGWGRWAVPAASAHSVN